MTENDDSPETFIPSGDKSPPGEVIRLTSHDTASADRVLRDLRKYWSGLRQGRAVPARADVDPRAISRSLDYTFILERIAPGAARIRLAGRHLIDLMGMEVRGMPICAFLNGPSRGRLSDVLETVFKAPQIAHLTLHAKPDYARPALSAQMLLLPLRSDLGDITRALGCIVADGEIGVAPRRFDLLRDDVTPVIEGGQTLTPSPSVIGFAEKGDSFLRKAPKRANRFDTAPPAASPEERRALFRLVGSGPEDPRD